MVSSAGRMRDVQGTILEGAAGSDPSAGGAAVPTRLVARQVSQFLFTRARRWEHVTGLEVLPAFIFEVVLGATMQHQPYRAGADGEWIPLRMGATLGRPVSRMAIAGSMGIPMTTVRRQVDDLISAGFLERRVGPLKVADAFFLDPRLEAFARDDVAALADMLRLLARAGYAPAQHCWPADFDKVPAGVLERLLLVFTLRVFETFTVQNGGLVPSLIVAAINMINIHAITDDPVLAARYAGDDTLPPDDVRVPVSVRTLAQHIEFPFETTRRHVAALERAGTVVRRKNGVIVPGDVLRNPVHLENIHRITGHLVNMLNIVAGWR